jgi:spore coat polysaccharide biosynthesis protein SpsF (cytidylyltransferase family)
MKMVTPAVDIIVATPYEDLEYKAVAEYHGVRWAGGSRHCVLERIVKATRGYERMVLVNGDSPLMCPRLVDRMLATHKFEGMDVFENLGPSGFRAKVIDVEFLAGWLRWVDESMEHILVPAPLYKHVCLLENQSKLKFSVDTMDEVEFVRAILKGVPLDAPLQELLKVANVISGGANNGTGDPTGHTPIGSSPVD